MTDLRIGVLGVGRIGKMHAELIERQTPGATVSADALKDADIIIKVKRPEASELSKYKRGALVIAIMDPYGNEAALKKLGEIVAECASR